MTALGALGFYALMLFAVWILGFVGDILGQALFDFVERLYAPRRKRLVAAEIDRLIGGLS